MGILPTSPKQLKTSLLLSAATFALCLLIPFTCQADTYVSGTILADTTWTKANNRYIVIGSIVISPGVTLTIEPGVKVKFNGNYSIYVDGTLKAIGTPAEHIIFTTDIPYWGKIQFRESSAAAAFDTGGDYASGCTLQYCVVEYAQGPDGAIHASRSSPFINFCTVQFNKCRGIAYGSWFSSGQEKITNCLIHHNLGGGLLIDWGTNPMLQISGNWILNNTVSGRGGGISFNYGGFVFYNNIIANNNATDKGGGIYSDYPHITLNNNVLFNNTAKAGGGAYLAGAIGSFAGTSASCNSFLNNSADNYAAIGCLYQNNTFLHNLFMNNQSNISSSETMGFQGPFTIGLNNILNNNTTFLLRALGGNDSNAQNNWWNTTDQAKIELAIFDKLDLDSLGMITFYPFLSAIDQDAPISPPQNVKIFGGVRVKLSWDPNPEPDIAGYKLYWGKKPGFPYENSRTVGKNVTSYEFLDLPAGNLYFAITAYDNSYSYAADNPATPVNENQTSGHESWFSTELSARKLLVPAPWLHLLLPD
jgi:hypothetical protein